MRHRLHLTSIVLALAMSGNSAVAGPTVIRAPLCNAGNVTVVGNFDQGLSPWSRIPGGGDFVSGTGYSGTSGIRTQSIDSASCNGYGLYATFSVSGGRSYILSGMFNTEGLQHGNLYIDLGDEPWEPQGQGEGYCSWVRGLMAPIGVPGWQLVYERVDVPPGISSVTIRVVRDGPRETSDVGFVDDVGFTPLEHFVPPTAGPSILIQPTDQVADVDVPVFFMVQIDPRSDCTSSVNYQWQRRNPLVSDSSAAGAWIDLADSDGFMNTRNPILGITRPVPSLATGYRCRISSLDGRVTVYSNTVNFSVACPADFNADGGVDFSDVEAFFERWENGC